MTHMARKPAKRLKNAYMPTWVPWFLVAILSPIFGLIVLDFYSNKISYMTVFLVSVILFIILITMFVVSYKRIPYMPDRKVIE